jgi:hypothetical protein
MNIEHSIQEYIAGEKHTPPSPQLESRILATIARQGAERPRFRRLAVPLLQSLAVAASIALVILLGIALGNILEPAVPAYDEELALNDSEIEQFSIYMEDEN